MLEICKIVKFYNGNWSIYDILFLGIFLSLVLVIIINVYKNKILKRQAISIIILSMFLGIVFGATVFTRPISARRYELIPFWSWKEIIVRNNRKLLLEDILNCILLIPMGVLLPFIVNDKIKLKKAFWIGFFVSAMIESCQLIFQRGLFEWDDMIHNGLGCLVGTIIGNIGVGILKKIKFRIHDNCSSEK